MLCKRCAKTGDGLCDLAEGRKCSRCRKGKKKCEPLHETQPIAASSSNTVAAPAGNVPRPVVRPPPPPPQAGPSKPRTRRSDEAVSEDDVRYARKTVAAINDLLQDWVAHSPGLAASYFPLKAKDDIEAYLARTTSCVQTVRLQGWTMQEGNESLAKLRQVDAALSREGDPRASNVSNNTISMPPQQTAASFEQEQPPREQRTESAPAQHVRQEPLHNEEENELDGEESEENTSEEDESEAEQPNARQVKEEEQEYVARPSMSTNTSPSANAGSSDPNLRFFEHRKKRTRVE